MEDQQTNAKKAIQRAPLMCGIALIVIALTYAYNKLFAVGVFVGPIVGMISFCLEVWSWRTGKQWFSGLMTGMFCTLSIIAVQKGGFIWGLPQALAIATLFVTLPMWLFGPLVLRWIGRNQS